uniref:DUF6535 domain-containing protein n=1 Tax=Mycena chlorophos TaxID=658473 RepID=A0ABQ0LCI7_MYCCL|nr:predicted protein [Mycena chlorophos]
MADYPDDRDHGAAKLWSVYVNEAEKYDKSLVESWSSDMEGILIFAGLFSASLTAFLVESYTNLSPDPANATVILLTDISRQLSALSHNTTFTPQPAAPFTPPTSAIVCNAFWFISLGLSLASALVASLLEQWTRDFLHRANMRSSPVVRARAYSFLYYGLRRFRMHAVVDLIPSLLHAALFFFFAGLVAFLIPVNAIMAALVAVILIIAFSVYAFLTVLPLVAADSPYRTPLSNGVWAAYRRLVAIFTFPSTHGPAPFPTLVEKVMHGAQSQETLDLQERDFRALSWTLRSLSDHQELETFLEAVPDALELQNPQYAAYFGRLRDQDARGLALRISSLLRSCSDGLLSPDVIHVRLFSCLRALWAIASIPDPPSTWDFAAELLLSIRNLPDAVYDDSLRAMTLSVKTLLQWNTSLRLASLKIRSRFKDESSRHAFEAWALTHLAQIKSNEIKSNEWLLAGKFVVESRVRVSLDEATTPRELSRAQTELQEAIADMIFFQFYVSAALSGVLPHRWEDTRRIIIPPLYGSSESFGDQTMQRIETAIQSTMLGVGVCAATSVMTGTVANSDDLKIRRTKIMATIDPLLADLCSLWRPQEARLMPASLLNCLDTELPSRDWVLARISKHLWSSLLATLLIDNRERSWKSTDQIFRILWSLAYRVWQDAAKPSPDVVHTLSQCVLENYWSRPLALFVKYLLKSKMLENLSDAQSFSWAAIQNLLPNPSYFPPPDDLGQPLAARDFFARIGEAHVSNLASLLENFQERRSHEHYLDTVRRVAAIAFAPLAPVHPAHQTRFALHLQMVAKCVDDPKIPVVECREIVRAIVLSKIFDGYSQSSGVIMKPGTVPRPYVLWIEDKSTRNDMINTLSMFERLVPEVNGRMQRILAKLKNQGGQPAK